MVKYEQRLQTAWQRARTIHGDSHVTGRSSIRLGNRRLTYNVWISTGLKYCTSIFLSVIVFFYFPFSFFFLIIGPDSLR